jgi:crotonobetainyl-CoA:carnitine CoA-transferase CaiB-like acyl-CoA transferase
MTDSRVGTIAVPDVVPRLSETPGQIRWLGEGLGARNDEIYKDLLELTSAEIDDLRISGVI